MWKQPNAKQIVDENLYKKMVPNSKIYAKHHNS